MSTGESLLEINLQGDQSSGPRGSGRAVRGTVVRVEYAVQWRPRLVHREGQPGCSGGQVTCDYCSLGVLGWSARLPSVTRTEAGRLPALHMLKEPRKVQIRKKGNWEDAVPRRDNGTSPPVWEEVERMHCFATGGSGVQAPS